MKTILCCIALVALVALVSADAQCDLKYYSGQKCDEAFCEKVKDVTAQCKESLTEKAGEKSRHSREVENQKWGKMGGSLQFTAEQTKMFKQGCEKMRKCVEDQVQEEQQFKDLAEYCKAVTREDNHDEVDEQGIKIPKNYNMCMAMNGMSCCGIKPQFGFGHGGFNGGHKNAQGDETASLMAPENQIMSMFL